MALWEYKVITSGKGGFASATMLESYLNQLGKDEWEIVDFRSDANNPLAFNGLARRPTQREWTLEAAVAAAAKAEADKLRAEFIHKQHAGEAGASADARAGVAAGDKATGPDELRQLRDTDRDHDPEALADEASHGAEDWANLDNFEDDLPTFFDAIKPHLRKNPATPGQSVALNYLAKRWEQPEQDLHGALRECGFVIPENETDAPAFIEFEGDLYWVEKNNRGLFFLNTREKPRPKFRVVQGKPLDPTDPVHVTLAEEQAAIEAERAKRAAEQAAREAEAQARRAEREAQRLAAEQARREQQIAAQAARDAARAASAAATAVFVPPAEVATEPSLVATVSSEVVEAKIEAAPASENDASTSGVAGSAASPVTESAPVSPAPAQPGRARGLPKGEALLDAIRPQMRRNRRGPGYSGSSVYLAKFFKVEEPVLKAALAELGLAPPEGPSAKSEMVSIGAYVYWVNKDGAGVLWINGREAGPGERVGANKTARSSSPGVQASPVVSEPSTATTVIESDDREASVPAQADSVSAVIAAESEATQNEPPIFRAVPRAMPPLPPVAEAVSEPLPETAAAPAVVEPVGDVSQPTEIPVVSVEAEAIAPFALEASVADTVDAPTKPAARKSGKPGSAKKSKVKPTDSAESAVSAAESGGVGEDAGATKPVSAKAGSRPRAKRRAPGATDADAAADS
jgi:hypothetical protein